MLVRIISSIIGIAIGITVLFLSDTLLFNAAISVICVIMSYELLNAGGCLKYKFASSICFAFALLMPFAVETENVILRYFFCLLCVLLLFIALLKRHATMGIETLAYMITTTMLATLSMCCLVLLLHLSEVHGVSYVLLCLLGAWLGDSGAYFIGSKFGKHKLCPNISPKKTVEGAIGGLVTVALSFLLYSIIYRAFMAYFYDVKVVVHIVPMLFMGLSCGVLGIVGDLSASIIKRQFNIKDFGKIMPGHGGIMDRFDSVLFVAPFMALVLTAFNIYS
jgi:phosphatidate cytidylyltransferase